MSPDCMVVVMFPGQLRAACAVPGSGNAKDVLAELFQLLEEFAPTWYTEDHHNRALAALQSHNRPA